MASAKYRNLFQYLKNKVYPEGFTKQDKTTLQKFAKKFEYDSKLESLFYVAKEKDGTALRRLVITEEEKARVFEAGATLLLSLDTPAAIILLHPVKVVPKVWYLVGIDLIEAPTTSQNGNRFLLSRRCKRPLYKLCDSLLCVK